MAKSTLTMARTNPPFTMTTLLAALLVPASALSGFDWSGVSSSVEPGLPTAQGAVADSGEGSFTTTITANRTGNPKAAMTIGEIPVGVSDIFIGLKSRSDIDIRLYDSNGTKIVHWPDGLLNGPLAASTLYQNLVVEWSGYNGDCGWDFEPPNAEFCSQGNEFISIRGTTARPLIVKAFGYESGEMAIDYSWGKFTIYAGISGSDPSRGLDWFSELVDGGKGVEAWEGAAQLKRLVFQEFQSQFDREANTLSVGLFPNAVSHLEAIAERRPGGMVAIAYNVANSVLSRSAFYGAGNTDQIRARIETAYDENELAKIFIVGFSAGGGDTQNLAWKLRRLGIPIELTGQIDSIELFDAEIPCNVERAMGFHQKDYLFTRGEDNLFSESDCDAPGPRITNELIVEAQGPNTGSFQYHANMDNDERVWKPLLDHIKSNR